MQNINLKNNYCIQKKDTVPTSGITVDKLRELAGIRQTSMPKDSVTISTENKSSLRQDFEATKKQQGIIGKAWDGFKNFFHMKSGSKNVENIIKQAEKGEISEEEAKNALEKYKEGQKTSVDVVADITSGILAVGAFALAVPTGGASLAVGLTAATAIGAATKIGIKAGDAKATGKEYSGKDLLYDTATGAVNGLLAPVTNGIGNCVTKTIGKKLGLKVVQEGAEEVAEQAIKHGIKQTAKNVILNKSVDVAGGTVAKRAVALGTGMAVDGALGGASDNMVRAALNGQNIAKAGIDGAVGGLIMSPIIGGGFRMAGKAGSKISNKIANNTPDLSKEITTKSSKEISEEIADTTVAKSATPKIENADTAQPTKADILGNAPESYWEEDPYLDSLRYKIYEDSGAFELIDDSPYKIKPKDILPEDLDSIPFNYDGIQELNILNLTLSTNKKGVRGSTIFGKDNRKNIGLLREKGITQVIDLRDESNINKSKFACDKNGLEYTFFPVFYNSKMTAEQRRIMMESLPDFIKAMDKGNFYIGCCEGTNRTDVAFGLNYLFNPNENIVPVFESKNPLKSFQMTKQITNDLLKMEDGKYLYLTEEFVQSLGWKDIDTFVEAFNKKSSALASTNVNK